ncbi:MAG: HAMP domain-containing histidine kinase [Syntrophorhabdaceae bacterium]|nr:HAMP domain-containing histidine kinase [Syntrophorhabdaceae bacterium]
MDRKVIEAYRLSLFGRMAMGLSHEVDNHLSIVIGFSEIIQITASNPEKVRDSAGKILMAGEKIAALIKQYSHYVRPHAPEREFFSAEQAIQEILLIARYDLGRHGNVVEAPVSYPQGLILGDQRDFALAFLALLFNAVEATMDKSGTVLIGVSLNDSGWEISVTDNGAGIPAGMEETVFEEGFTSHSESFHSGMGLPVARHVISEVGGTLRLENVLGKGCVATIRLPASYVKQVV